MLQDMVEVRRIVKDGVYVRCVASVLGRYNPPAEGSHLLPPLLQRVAAVKGSGANPASMSAALEALFAHGHVEMPVLASQSKAFAGLVESGLKDLAMDGGGLASHRLQNQRRSLACTGHELSEPGYVFFGVVSQLCADPSTYTSEEGDSPVDSPRNSGFLP